MAKGYEREHKPAAAAVLPEGYRFIGTLTTKIKCSGEEVKSETKKNLGN
jgi:hypothetical protein